MKELLRSQRRGDMKKLGSEYGGWVIPMSVLSDSSVCYCVGVGEDITFDLALIDHFDCRVFAFDPTPRAALHVELHAKDVPNFHFYNVGVWREDQEGVRFYAPRDSRHVSHSIVNLQGTSDFFEAECKRLSSLMKDLGHRRIDLLKLDVEGAEYDVLDTVMKDGLDVGVVCVEFDQPSPLIKTWKIVRTLNDHGYALVSVDKWNYTFVSNLLDP